ncbi:MAG: Crp/Fnr family transcriptional regulator [Bacteroidota bacterium]
MELSATYLKERLPTIADSQLREDILTHGVLRTFPAGETLLTDEQYIDYIPLITSGGAKVVRFTKDHRSLFLYFLRGGETCTMTLSSCLKRETSRVRAKTVTKTEVILLPVARVYYYTRHFPSWNEFALASFQAKFDAILYAFEEMAFVPLPERVLHYLKEVAAIKGENYLGLSHGELAEDLGVSRVGISRVLKSLEHNGKLDLGRKKITLREAQSYGPLR